MDFKVQRKGNEADQNLVSIVVVLSMELVKLWERGSSNGMSVFVLDEFV